MLTLSYREGNIQHFRGNTSDITTTEEMNAQIKKNSHTEPHNGDECYIIQGSKKGNVLMYDEENANWEEQ